TLEIFLFCSIIEKGEENCGHLIEAHKECMRALGFKI
ncbi:PREDICTED: cytochrome c oxidase copper chaperone, partial [Pygoscelis adeliae]